MRRPIIIAALLLVAATPAIAETPPPICADRPGKATSACSVPQGMVQIETGLADWTLQKSGGERDTSLALGQTTIKYGLTTRSDIEISITPFERATSSAGGVHDSASGFGDTNIIYKQQLTSSDAAVQVTLYPFVKIPTAPRSLGNGQWEGGLKIPIGYAIAKRH